MGDSTKAGERNVAHNHEESVRETLISIIIAFAMAFIFRSFVVEPFIIPTGSAAPTLLGAHVHARSPYTGFEWTQNPRDFVVQGVPAKQQGSSQNTMTLTDPMTGPPASKQGLTAWGGREAAGKTLTRTRMPRRMGDRILVLKHIYSVRDPRRWEVIVLKNPGDPKENLIKRMVGLPNETLRLADGDVFARPLDANGDPAGEWSVQRKPAHVQRKVWRTLFSSEYTPLGANGSTWRSPWLGDEWDQSGPSYRLGGAASAELLWDDDRWPITDWVYYNEQMPVQIIGGSRRPGRVQRYPVSDVRLRAGVEPGDERLVLRARVEARGHIFEAEIGPAGALTRMKRTDAEGWTPGWADTDVKLKPGRINNVEFWHVDQTLQLWLDGELAGSWAYEWGPEERMEHAMVAGRDPRARRAIEAPDSYRATRVRWFFDDAEGGVTVHRVGLDRDLHYQPASPGQGGNALNATTPATEVTLGEDQFFALGDNSGASRDARMWDSVDSWVAREVDDTPRVLPRKLIMGKAFFVYFPAPLKGPFGIPMPDFGRMRFIW